MVLVLETPSPTERAVFVLREAFDVGYDEIAAAVGKNPAAVRQIAHRAPPARRRPPPAPGGLPGRGQGGPGVSTSAAPRRPGSRSPASPRRSTAIRRSPCTWTARSTASWRSGSWTAASPASPASATPRS
nr:sigma factor-like helix-turn-helix DNA-binding protein [Streptomyces cinereoruber]